MEQLLSKISEKYKKTPSVGVFTDMFAMVRECGKTDLPLALKYGRELSNYLDRYIPVSGAAIKDLFALHKRVLHWLAPNDFHSAILYAEWNREPSKQFYRPRMKVLRQVVDALQDLTDDKLDLLAISLPPGAGKTTLAIFYLTWLGLKRPDEPKLTGSHSNAFIRGVYDECLRMLDPQGEYLWGEIFPGVSVTNTNAKDCRIDIGKRKRFETLEFTSTGMVRPLSSPLGFTTLSSM